MTSTTNHHNERPLPYGWVKEFDQSGFPFYVDTHAVPPRSIWTHPHEDEQFLRDHPDVREKVGNTPHEYSAPDGPPPGHSSASKYAPPKGKRGFFGKLKDKAIGTKEEREAEKQRTAMIQEQRRQQYAASRPMPGFAQTPAPYGYQQGGMGMGGMSMGGSSMGGMGGVEWVVWVAVEEEVWVAWVAWRCRLRVGSLEDYSSAMLSMVDSTTMMIMAVAAILAAINGTHDSI
ncbi:hypothetical protein CPB85DRAFT_1431221 [Mucidula mucida]|nr:hypothetical protein CPB85DRAFT_1431221 [Mucidula mucida]